jgi:hypothetical protein
MVAVNVSHGSESLLVCVAVNPTVQQAAEAVSWVLYVPVSPRALCSSLLLRLYQRVASHPGGQVGRAPPARGPTIA